MTQVHFVKLTCQDKLPQLCRLTAEFYHHGQRVLLLVPDQNQAIALDRFLWSWDKGSFLPHAFDNGSVDCSAEPIVITGSEQNANNGAVLILAGPGSLEFISRFDQVIDFAEVYDAALAEQARERFRQYRTRGFTPDMYAASA